MFYLEGIDNTAKQEMTVPLSDGTSFVLSLEYKPMQTGWFYNINWNGNSFAPNGNRLVASPNCFRQWRAQIPFGLACITANFVEPLHQNDFINGIVTSLILLEGDDVQNVEDQFYPNT